MRVPNSFFEIRNFSSLKLGNRALKAKLGRDSGLKVCVGGGMRKKLLGLVDILGWDYGMEDPIEDPHLNTVLNLFYSWIGVAGGFSSLRSVVLEHVVEPNIGSFYRKSKESDSNRLLLPNNVSSGRLNYLGINENVSRLDEKSSHFDCEVKSEVDFAKLFLDFDMCNFTSFKDCDFSTFLALLSKVPGFKPDVKAAAETVRMLVKEWAHCNPVNWDQAKSLQSFREMKRLVGVLSLTSEVRSKLLGKLEFWENIGKCQHVL